MIVLGIDPSSTSAGYGIVKSHNRQCIYLTCGCIRPKTDLTLEDRLVFLYEELEAIIAAHRPNVAAVESTFVGKDARAHAKLGEARGVLVVTARRAGLPIFHYTPAEVKKAMTGNGRATKEQVRYMVAGLLGVKDLPRPLDASDALAIALCHMNRPEFRGAALGRARKPEIEALLKRARR